MTETYPLLERILTCINSELGLEAFCKAIKAYDNKSLPIPIKYTYFTVAAEETPAEDAPAVPDDASSLTLGKNTSERQDAAQDETPEETLKRLNRDDKKEN